MKVFTNPIIGVEEFKAMTAMCSIWRDELGEMLLRVLDLGEVS